MSHYKDEIQDILDMINVLGVKNSSGLALHSYLSARLLTKRTSFTFYTLPSQLLYYFSQVW
jgi:hypothetical protein